jgi:hypothetical protein
MKAGSLLTEIPRERIPLASGYLYRCQILGVRRDQVLDHRYHGVDQLAIDAQQADSILLRPYSNEGMYMMRAP